MQGYLGNKKVEKKSAGLQIFACRKKEEKEKKGKEMCV